MAGTRSPGLSRGEIDRIVHRYIGVDAGYLGDFSYATHARFYPDYCDIDSVDPYSMEGTTRERFIAILSGLPPVDQARVLRGVLDRFPVDEGPPSRNAELRDQMLAWADRCAGHVVDSGTPATTSAAVTAALADAEALIRQSGASSGVDRLHTALHGHLLALCDAASIDHPDDASSQALLKLLRRHHPALQEVGPRPQEIATVLNACGTILDALRPIRNRASLAHPNEQLLPAPEAALIINVTRTVLHYLDTKLAAAST